MKDKILNLLFLAGVLALMGAGFREYLIHHGKLTSELNANGFAITNVPPPSADGDAANKGYVDDTAEAIADSVDFTTNNTTLVETIEEVAPTPGDYANVSNKAVNALQDGARADSLDIGSTSDHWHLSGGMNFRIKDGGARPTSVFYWPGYGDTYDLARLYEVTSAIIAATNAIDMSAYIPWSSANSYASATDYSLCLERDDYRGHLFAIEEGGTGGDGPFLFKTFTSTYDVSEYPDYRPRIYVGFIGGHYLAYYYDVIAATNTLATTLRGEIAAIDVAPTVSNTVTQTYIRERLGVYLVYTNGMIKVYMPEN